MSSFLMCVYDETSKSWLTVTKVSNGFTDAQLSQINKNLKMNKISKDPNQVGVQITASKMLLHCNFKIIMWRKELREILKF